jgi:hypothetical protein
MESRPCRRPFGGDFASRNGTYPQEIFVEWDRQARRKRRVGQ